jgi:hypothetical protein
VHAACWRHFLPQAQCGRWCRPALAAGRGRQVQGVLCCAVLQGGCIIGCNPLGSPPSVNLPVQMCMFLKHIQHTYAQTYTQDTAEGISDMHNVYWICTALHLHVMTVSLCNQVHWSCIKCTYACMSYTYMPTYIQIHTHMHCLKTMHICMYVTVFSCSIHSDVHVYVFQCNIHVSYSADCCALTACLPCGLCEFTVRLLHVSQAVSARFESPRGRCCDAARSPCGQCMRRRRHIANFIRTRFVRPDRGSQLQQACLRAHEVVARGSGNR